MTNQLSQEEIEQWNIITEYIRRVDGKAKADKFKNNTVNPAIEEGRSWKQASGGHDFNKTKKYISEHQSSKIYSETDRVMNLGTKISPGDDIYIDCRPTNTFGEKINPGENIKTMDTTNSILDELSDSLDGKNILENVGFQIMIGILLFSIIYYIGNYVFVKYPKKILDI